MNTKSISYFHNHFFTKMIATLSAADPHLSRLDLDSLPLQTQMELLVESLEGKTKFQDSEGGYFDVSSWIGVNFYENAIVKIGWRDSFWGGHVHGSLDLRWLPPTVRDVSITGTKMQGTVDMQNLPKNIEHLYLQRNALSGTIDLSNISDKFFNLVLHTNRFSGTLDLSALPPYIRYLCLQANEFHGDVRIGPFPKSLVSLRLEKNKLGAVTDGDGERIDDPRLTL